MTSETAIPMRNDAFPPRKVVCEAIQSPPFLLAVVLCIIGGDDPAVDDVDN